MCLICYVCNLPLYLFTRLILFILSLPSKEFNCEQYICSYSAHIFFLTSSFKFMHAFSTRLLHVIPPTYPCLYSEFIDFSRVPLVLLEWTVLKETGPKGEKGEPGFRGETGLKVKLMVYRTSIIWKIHCVNVIGRLLSQTYSASAYCNF